ncbi:hypothetical protein RFI36_15100 [Acinetobacter gerneri]|jgi:hypothetical protein|uniref:Uncharacterized protein n=1 Tax=Acinetobacter gerneri TaxID=202952 RepID=A0AAW8JMA3_9GAMM|nr:hypothetical protein [Acinetobacter gerneri]MCH4245872.1 hypothetical protein [Acinetobacter gerneri]MDQ9010982.1 hypothetical protein [Acinetobacter gerneri]MDQ9015169.1 hypothetical protein [Acinetobacter gerneri]MDQ9026276.1 hypothetical protein [Acinetobacter gerneri]MDQ9053570.1 hypothetical protein [Acinetobacter gerneri]
MKKYILVLLSALFFSSTLYANDQQDDRFYDLFPGTVVQKDNQLYLHTCRAADALFLLKFNHAEDQAKVSKLVKKYKKFWLYVSAYADEKNGKYYMTVNKIVAQHLNETCQLTDLLDELGS